jgi:hypothetical protein
LARGLCKSDSEREDIMSNMSETDNGEPQGKYWDEFTEEEKRAFIERARKELPALDAQHERSMRNLRRIAGLRPIR